MITIMNVLEKYNEDFGVIYDKGVRFDNRKFFLKEFKNADDGAKSGLEIFKEFTVVEYFRRLNNDDIFCPFEVYLITLINNKNVYLRIRPNIDRSVSKNPSHRYNYNRLKEVYYNLRVEELCFSDYVKAKLSTYSDTHTTGLYDEVFKVRKETPCSLPVNSKNMIHRTTVVVNDIFNIYRFLKMERRDRKGQLNEFSLVNVHNNSTDLSFYENKDGTLKIYRTYFINRPYRFITKEISPKDFFEEYTKRGRSKETIEESIEKLGDNIFVCNIERIDKTGGYWNQYQPTDNEMVLWYFHENLPEDLLERLKTQVIMDNF